MGSNWFLEAQLKYADPFPTQRSAGMNGFKCGITDICSGLLVCCRIAA